MNTTPVPSFMKDGSPPASLTENRALNQGDYDKFIHPDDEAAIRFLKALPGFDVLVRATMAGTLEKMLYGQCLGTSIKLGPNQLAEYYGLLTPVCEKFGISPVPELFMEMSPIPNAYTFGDTKPFIVMSSGLLEHLTREEVQVCLAHECGHIVCGHSLYTMMSVVIESGISWLPLSDIFRLPIYRWRRMSEFSADRAAAIFAGNSQKVINLLIRLSGGRHAHTHDVNLAAYQEQVKEYQTIINDTNVESAMQTYLLAFATHPFSSMRSHEIIKWTEGAAFSFLSKTIGTYDMRCSRCNAPMQGNTNICTNGHFC